MTRQEQMEAIRRAGHVGALPIPHGGLMTSASAAGGLVRIIPKLVYAAYPAQGQTEDIVLAKYVDTSHWVSGVLIVRVHSITINAAGQFFDVNVESTSFGEEEPSATFAYTATPVATVRLSSASPPALLCASLSAPIGGQVRVVLRVTQSGETERDMECEIGVDLVGRRA